MSSHQTFHTIPPCQAEELNHPADPGSDTARREADADQHIRCRRTLKRGEEATLRTRLSLRVMAMAFVNSAFHWADRDLSEPDRIILLVRVDDAIRAGKTDVLEVAIAALEAHGLKARYEVRGELAGLTLVDAE